MHSLRFITSFQLFKSHNIYGYMVIGIHQFTLRIVGLNLFSNGGERVSIIFLFCVIVELTTLIFHLWTEIFFHHVDV